MPIDPLAQCEGRGKGFLGVPGELNSALAERLSGALPLLATIYALVAGLSLFGQAAVDRILDGQTALLAGLCTLGVWAFLRRGRIALDRMHLVGACISGMVLAQGLTSLRFSD